MHDRASSPGRPSPWAAPVIALLATTALGALTAAPVLAQDWSASPTFGTISLETGFTPDPHAESLSAGGSDEVTLKASGCVGYINASAPDFDLNFEAGSLSLYIFAEGGEDLTLVINDPSGRWHCSDDWSGTNPMVEFANPESGNYNIWVGTWSNDGLAPAQLFISEFEPDDDFGSSEPNFAAQPTFGTVNLDAGFTPDPWSSSLEAGGSDEVTLSASGCTGYINASAPDFDLNYEAGSMPLYIFAQGDADLTLVINDPSGEWHCNDDYDGTDPMVEFTDPLSGNYNIWVGVWGDGGTEPATLFISELSPDAPFDGAMPDVSAAPVYETIDLSAGFTPDPREFALSAGGSDEVVVEGDGCAGYINASAPDFDLNYDAGSLSLFISAESDADLTLVVNDPAGRWHCSDDENGLNPGIEFVKPLSGNYNIWVGTYSDTDYQPATLRLSELGFGS